MRLAPRPLPDRPGQHGDGPLRERPGLRLTVEHCAGVAVRSPLLPLATLDTLTGGAARTAWTAGGDLDAAVAADRAHLAAGLRALLADETVRAAIALASPDLDAGLDRWLGSDAPPPPGLLGYVARMAGRCAPYGLFAGCAAGQVTGTPAYAAGPGLRVRARLDVGTAERAAYGTLGPDTLLVPNATAHLAAERLRLVERDDAGRFHPVAVEPDDALLAVLDAARDGATLAHLAGSLTGDGVTAGEAAEYVAELVAAQVLVPDVPVVTRCAVPRPPEVAALDGGVTRAALRAAVAAVRDRVPGVAADRAVHVDSARETAYVLGDAVLAEARRAVALLHPLYRETAADADLAAFAAAFAERYGAAEVPLLEALDPETGVGYGPPVAVAAAGAPLLASFEPARPTDGPRWTPVDHHLVDLLSRALRDRAYEIEPGPADLGPLRNPRARPLPDAFALVGTVAARSAADVARGDFRLVVHGVRADGAGLAGRFADLDARIDALLRRFVAAEDALRPDAVHAEVVHRPDRRGGNVAVRPVLRDHEIPLLAASGVAPERRVLPADLRVSVAGGRVTLRSERLGRVVLPRLTAAHDVRASALPAYRFLAAVAHQGTAATLRWSWGQVESAPFLPRVVSGRLVLSRAQWRWYRLELADLENAATPAARYAAVQRLREAWDVPRWATLARGDHEVPVDLDGVAAAELLAREARRAGQLWLRELLPAPDEAVLDGYAHEVVLPFVRTSVEPLPAVSPRPRPRAYVPGSEWLGVRLATGPASADGVLRDLVAPLVAGVARWSYERVPDGLRVALRGVPVDAVRAAVAPLVDSGRLADVTFETWRPVTDERLAHADSVAALRVVARGDDLDARWRAAAWGVDALLADAGLDLPARRAALGGMKAREALGETGERATRHAGRLHRAGRLAPPDAALVRILGERSAVVAPVLRAAGTGALDELCAGHVNRLVRAAHDVQRLVLYDLLDRVYSARLGRGFTPGGGRS